MLNNSSQSSSYFPSKKLQENDKQFSGISSYPGSFLTYEGEEEVIGLPLNTEERRQQEEYLAHVRELQRKNQELLDKQGVTVGDCSYIVHQQVLPEGISLENGYSIKKMLATGGMGQVYLCSSDTSDQQVVLKIMLPKKKRAHSDSSALMTRFDREIAVLRTLDHPNIIAYKASGVIRLIDENGQQVYHRYVIMDYHPEGDLSQRFSSRNKVKYQPPLSSEEVLDVFKTLFMSCARGLDALHSRGFIHRDIKPSNIFIAENGQGIIGDLGLVKLIDDQYSQEKDTFSTADYLPLNTHITSSLGMVGTPAYFSPEQLNASFSSHKYKVGYASDWFALGLCFYKVLTGKHVVFGHKNPNLQQIYQRYKKLADPLSPHFQEFIPVHVLNPAVPLGVSYFIMSLLAFKPEHRGVGQSLVERMNAVLKDPSIVPEKEIRRQEYQSTVRKIRQKLQAVLQLRANENTFSPRDNSSTQTILSSFSTESKQGVQKSSAKHSPVKNSQDSFSNLSELEGKEEAA